MCELANRSRPPPVNTAFQLGVSAAALHKWVRQDQIDRGERPGTTTLETTPLTGTSPLHWQVTSIISRIERVDDSLPATPVEPGEESDG